MKILLSYSLSHFDPNKKPEEQKHWGSSASILARTLYYLLKDIGDVTYIDSTAPEAVKGKRFDLFVGIGNNFDTILNQCQIKKSLYFAVNMHPSERNYLLSAFVRDNKLPAASLADWDIAHERTLGRALKAADGVLLVGNTVTYNSYLKHGLSPQKVKLLNYGLDDLPVAQKPHKKEETKPRFVYTVSEIGLRKGFDLIVDMFSDPTLQKTDFQLDLLGLPTNDHYQKKIDDLVASAPNKITYHGWIGSSTKQYRDLLREADYILLPSIEEGQAGSVIDAIAQGVVPILSSHAGIDHSPLGQFELKIGSIINQQLIQKALSLTIDERYDLKLKTLEYYREYHHAYKDNFKETIHNFLSDGILYPKVSLVLPIFNKQGIIKSLVSYLDAACKAYPNAELDIIFDGCKDKSETVVRDYFKNRSDYPVRFSVTPNIFEVKSNNLGLKRAKGKYAVIIQDDNFVYDKYFLFEAVNFLDKNSTAAILGGLAGVNYYPRGTTNLKGPGQIAQNEREVYWRQDAATNPELKHRTFQVDACMRGPLIFRTAFLKRYGYLDEIYAPLYQDDMDICFRAMDKGYKVYCMLMEVENNSLTQGHYDSKMNDFFYKTIIRNTDIFYKRWTPSIKKDYSWINRTPIWQPEPYSIMNNLKRMTTNRSIALRYKGRRLVRRGRNAIIILTNLLKSRKDD